MSVIRTDLRVYPVASARRVSVEPVSGIVALDVQSALEELQGEIITGSTTPAAIVPTAVNFAMSPYTVLATDYLLEVDTTGGAVVIQTAASASRVNKPFTVKDIAGNSAVNAISVLRTGAETIDGLSAYPIDSPYDAKTFKPKLGGTGYEVES